MKYTTTAISADILSLGFAGFRANWTICASYPQMRFVAQH